MNILISYRYLYDHPDPLFQEFTYGDGGTRARKIKNDLQRGDYVFFHNSKKRKKYITAYYVVDRALDTGVAIKDKNIVAKYKNPHILNFLSGKKANHDEDVVLFGDPISSRILERPLLFDKTLAEKLSLNIKFPEGKTETQIIGSATRQWRKLTDKDVEVLLTAIKLYEEKTQGIDTVLSTDEVTEVIEKDIEGFIEKNINLIGESLMLEKRQLETPVGRIDMLFKDKSENRIVVELKLNKIGRDAVNQLRRYMDWVKKETKKNVAGVIVCKGVMPAFENDFKKLKDVKILYYGWQLQVYS